jgi:hypothetical protein
MALSKINIPTIKTAIKTLLDAELTAELSADMSKEVRRVCKLNPENMHLQASLFPAVCVYTTSKTIDPGTIVCNQVKAQRFSRLRMTIAGMVWNQNFSADLDRDPADDDLEQLMENIEAVLRNSPTISGNSTWAFPSDVTYHNAAFDEETHFRIGFLDMELRIDY